MKKKLQIDAITNELEASAFFARNKSQSAEPKLVPAVTTPLKHEPKPITQQTNVPTNAETNERLFERRKIRHTFDIFEDQLLSLKEITLSRQKRFGKRELLGDLVQQALDMFITKERNNERSNE